jgi:putative ABC transport system permease protein
MTSGAPAGWGVDALRQDLRYAARMWVRAPGFTILAILTMAVGVGATAAVFSVVNAVLLRPLPFARPGELFLVQQTNSQTRLTTSVTPANFLDWRARSHAFAGLAAFRDEPFVVGGDPPARENGAVVNANFFDVLGTPPAAGRTFQPSDEERHLRVVILSDGFWRDRFGARRDVIGQTLQLNAEPHVIVGVMPSGIDYPDRARLWTLPHWRVPDDPLSPATDPATDRGHGYFFALGRLGPGVTARQAAGEMTSIAAALAREFPDQNTNVGAAITPLRDDLVGNVRPLLMLVFAAVGVVLLIATVNVSALLIARATTRTQEVAVRLALGASRGRIVGQLLTESMFLATVGGAAGMLLASWLVGPLVALSPLELGIATAVRIDGSVFAFTLLVSTIAGVAFGLAPARQLIAVDLHRDLKQTARGTAAPGQRRVRAALVSTEVALSMVLLVGAGLTIRSFVRLLEVSPGFDAARVVTATITLPDVRYPAAQQRADFWQQALDALRQIPGVETVGASSRLPLSGGNSTRSVTVDGRSDMPASADADYRTASPDYFRALGIPLLRGRSFEDSDRERRPLVAIVSASMAQRLWPNLDPIGHRLAMDAGPDMIVVGVVGDVHHAALDAQVQPTFYRPYRQDPRPSMAFALRAVGAADVRASVPAAIRRVDKDQPIGAIRTLDDAITRSLAQRRLGVTLLTTFGAIAVLLAGVGLYGVLAFVVSQRRREIGIRMALGATARDIVADILGQGLRLTAFGGAIGIVLALAATRLMSALLFGIGASDPATFAGAAVLLAGVAAAASLVPALRASRVAPLVALRDE